MEKVYMPMQFAPNNLTQAILPNWTFSLFDVDLGTSTNAEVEQEALKKVGSYGKQIGHLAEALEVVIQNLDLLENENLPEPQRHALQVFLRDVAKVRDLKPPA